MTKKELKDVQDRLLKRKQELLKQIQKNLDHSHQTSENKPSDLMDAASDSYEDDFNVSLAGREAEELAELNEALEKIKDGTYGKCSRCGQDIKPARLKALPRATLCLKCKEEDERGESEFGGTLVPKWE
jgi:DnaK suppressor protein